MPPEINIKQVFNALGLNVAKLTLNYSLQSEEKFQRIFNEFPDSEIANLLNLFPDFLVMLKNPVSGMFFVSYHNNLELIRKLRKQINQSKLPHDFLLVSSHKENDLIKISGMWVDSDKIDSITNLIEMRFDHKFSDSLISKIEEEFKTAV